MGQGVPLEKWEMNAESLGRGKGCVEPGRGKLVLWARIFMNGRSSHGIQHAGDGKV